jgi:hypothetical protein
MLGAMRKVELEPVLIEDLIHIGWDEGTEQGRAAGLGEGTLSTLRRSVLRVLEARGLLTDAALRDRLAAEQSTAVLGAMLDRAAVAAALEDLDE